MKNNRLGQSEIFVSQVSMGGMSLKNDLETSSKIIHQAIDLGINFFDTADLYERGKNEELFGYALAEKRSKVIIATKVGNEWNEDGTSWRWNPSKKYILSAVEKSLKRLKTDYIDLYQLHGGTIDDPIDETIEAFEILKTQGKIRAYGISSIRPNVIRAFCQKSKIASVMMQYSLLDRRPEETCLNLLKSNGISVITRGTLGKGLLAGKKAKTYLGHSEEEVKNAANAIKNIADKNNNPTSLTACQYVLQSETVASTVIGFRTMEQLTSCVNGEEISNLEMKGFQKLQNSVVARQYENHR